MASSDDTGFAPVVAAAASSASLSSTGKVTATARRGAIGKDNGANVAADKSKSKKSKSKPKLKPKSESSSYKDLSTSNANAHSPRPEVSQAQMDETRRKLKEARDKARAGMLGPEKVAAEQANKRRRSEEAAARRAAAAADEAPLRMLSDAELDAAVAARTAGYGTEEFYHDVEAMAAAAWLQDMRRKRALPLRASCGLTG